MNTLSDILDKKIVAIIRGANYEDALKIAESLYDGGVKVLEITMDSPKALDVIEKINDEFNGKILVGAGTVLDSHTARSAILSGAKFILSPTVDLETIKMTKRYGVVSIPGAFTPTEILSAFENGGDIIKVFPATLGPDYIKNIQGPLGHIPLLPTGGVNLKNISDFMKIGVAGFGIGSALVNTENEITDTYLEELSDKAKQFVSVIENSK